MIRKLLTKPVWWYERKRAYSVRLRHSALPPLSVAPGGTRFAVLTTPQSLPDALWAAWSWFRFLRGFELQLVIDGQLSPAAEHDARRLFPGISICEAGPLLDRFSREEPRLTGFLRGHPLGRKLGVVLALSQQGALLYSDHDVLAFNQPTELLRFIESNLPCFLLEEVDGTRDAEIVERAHAIGADYLPRFNSGLLYVPKGSLSSKLAADLVESWNPPVRSWFTEQTVFSVLMRDCGAMPLPEERYVVSNRRQFYWQQDVNYHAIAARHFTGTVRHVMYRYGIPQILRQSKLRSFAKEPDLEEVRNA